MEKQYYNFISRKQLQRFMLDLKYMPFVYQQYVISITT